MIRQGDRVKLTDTMARSLSRSGKHHKRKGGYKKIDWAARRGSVISYSSVTDSVHVKWDDRVTIDHWPAKAFEVVGKLVEVPIS
jgi:hypothetical protein